MSDLEMTVTPPLKLAMANLGLSPEQQRAAFIQWVKAVVTENEQAMLSAYPRQEQPLGGEAWDPVTPEYAARKEAAGYNPDEIGMVTGRMRNSLFHSFDLRGYKGNVGYPEIGEADEPKYPFYFHQLRKLLPVKSKSKQKAVALYWKMMKHQRVSGLNFVNGAALRKIGI